MKKCVCFVLAVISMLAVPVFSRAQTTPITPLDYYKIGQFMESTTFYSDMSAFPKRSDMRAKMDVERRLLVKMGPTQDVLVGFDHMVNALTTLPFDTSYASWTQTQKDQFTNSSADFNAIRAWLGSGDTQPRFYFWLGSDTEYLAKGGPGIIAAGNTLDSVQANYKSTINDYFTFPTSEPNSYKTALPAIQTAMAAIAAYNGKAIAATDVPVIQQQAQIIYDCANGKVSQ